MDASGTAKIDAGSFKLEKEIMTVADVIDDAMLAVHAQAATAGLTLLHIPNPAVHGRFKGCPIRARQVLVNLLSVP